jgi:hypothetical protein
MNTLLNENGRINSHTVCPFRKQCEIAQVNACRHRGEDHEIEFSCAVARGFDLLAAQKPIVFVKN